jgi:hypothetical protein
MQSLNSSTVNNNNINKYIPPNRKNNTVSPDTITKLNPSKLTKKKEPKKEFSLEDQTNAFPSLSRSDIDNNNNRPILSFANATKAEKIKPTEDTTSDIIPGWIHIRKSDGTIEYKEGPPTTRYPCSYDNYDVKLSSAMFKNRLAKDQYERDNDISRLGDLSEYYGEKTLYEMFADEDRLLYSTRDNENSSSSEYSDYDDYYDNTLFENKFESTNQI